MEPCIFLNLFLKQKYEAKNKKQMRIFKYSQEIVTDNPKQ